MDINITEFGLFSPATITITAGDSIRFVNSSDVVEPSSDPHPTHGNYTELNVGSIDTGSSATTPPLTKIGTWGYHDHLATSITGTITVVAQGGNTAGGNSCPDCLAPGVKSLTAVPVNHQSVVISWSTDEPAIFRVEFGTTTDYGSTTVQTSDFVIDHSFIIKNLEPKTFYYYRIFVKDRVGNEDFTRYSTQNFRTLPINIEATTTPIEKPIIILSKEEVIKEIKIELRALQDQLYVKLLESNFSFNNGLTIGSSGVEVRNLQILFSQDDSVYPEKQITGYFGPLTEKAVRRFQEKYGIETIGSVGPKTRAKLNQLIGR